ncbi:hypothetical protein Y032_0008g319 [Ancylostoma ceylanicum]|uniref:Uncharacterized protein n=1 Tax=Ancylostoma ceylanicum TaxID=53326 RepID=A0A016VMW0_9BILA|nr:hypothetical protein Y032_0008g319 [Ancylostoma ceylanicum]
MALSTNREHITDQHSRLHITGHISFRNATDIWFASLVSPFFSVFRFLYPYRTTRNLNEISPPFWWPTLRSWHAVPSQATMTYTPCTWNPSNVFQMPRLRGNSC